MLLTRLQICISKSLRDKDNGLNRSIGEVQGICKQLRNMFNEDEIDKFRNEKLQKLKELVW